MEVKLRSRRGERVASSLTLGLTRFSTRPPGFATFPLARVIDVRRATPRETHSAQGEGGSGRGGPGKGLTHKGPEVYSPLDFPLFGGLCWASWRQSETWEERRTKTLARGEARGPARDEIRRVKFREPPGAATRAGTMPIGK